MRTKSNSVSIPRSVDTLSSRRDALRQRIRRYHQTMRKTKEAIEKVKAELEELSRDRCTGCERERDACSYLCHDAELCCGCAQRYVDITNTGEEDYGVESEQRCDKCTERCDDCRTSDCTERLAVFPRDWFKIDSEHVQCRVLCCACAQRELYGISRAHTAQCEDCVRRMKEENKCVRCQHSLVDTRIADLCKTLSKSEVPSVWATQLCTTCSVTPDGDYLYLRTQPLDTQSSEFTLTEHTDVLRVRDFEWLGLHPL